MLNFSPVLVASLVENIRSMREKGLIIGGGAVGSRFHLPRFLNLVGCKKVAIVDSNEVQRSALQALYEGDGRISVHSEVPRTNFDIAVVATPPKFHLECFLQASQYCQQIIVEKPLTRTCEEARELAREAARRSVQVYVGLIRRSLKNFPMVRAWIEQGNFGNLNRVRIAEGFVIDWRAVSIGSFSRDLNGGGVLMDTGPHVLDQLFQIFDEVELVGARMDALPAKGSNAIEANTELQLKCDGVGVEVSLSRNRVLSNTATLEFQDANIVLGLHDDRVDYFDGKGHGVSGVCARASGVRTYPELFDDYYRDYILPGNNFGIDAESFIKIQHLIEMAYTRAAALSSAF